MSDCSNSSMQPYDVARLRIEFQDGEVPLMYPLALNGRTISGVYVSGVRVELIGECYDVSVDESQFICSKCECTVEIPMLWGVLNHCPDCGAKVMSDGE